EHNIQGIGDKHIPLIHNVMNTDVVCAVSDRATDELDVLFNTDTGRRHLQARRGLGDDVLTALGHFGLSSICNLLAAVKTVKLLGLGPDDAVLTVATDGAAMYPSERAKTLANRWPDGFGAVDAAEVDGRHLGAIGTDDMIECTERDRHRIFNLGYYTWVEQQGTPVDVFDARRSDSFWSALPRYLDRWDALITDFNGRVAGSS
ncbi:MAG TPA: pyridoxal-5'-phosphate-dependent protein subunit beta, partial [Acidimicrobiales bacterium]